MYDDLDQPSAAAQQLAARIYSWPDAEQRYRDGLSSIERLRNELDALELQLVAEARSARFTWAKIGSWLGRTRQGAFNRFAAGLGPESPPTRDKIT